MRSVELALLFSQPSTQAPSGVRCGSADTTVVVFDAGIGSQPFAQSGGVPVSNDVRGVTPGGRPWEIGKLKATVKTNRTVARIMVKGEGRILNGGNSTGTAGTPREVAATLFCGTNEAFNSQSVLVQINGDFEIKSPLLAATSNNVLPTPCGTPAAPPILLIRNAPGGIPGAWFAADIPRDLNGAGN